MRISEVTTRTGVPASTLRFYESLGLVSAERLPNGYRSYGPDALERLALIDAAKDLGLQLPEIAELLGVVDRESCTRVRDVLHPRLTAHLTQVDEQIARLQSLRSRLITATEDVGACPDAATSCRSECMLLNQHDEDPCPVEDGLS